jgi:hypothetical protein
MVKEKLQKQMMSVAEQQQRLNKVRLELEKLEVVRDTTLTLLLPNAFDFRITAHSARR